MRVMLVWIALGACVPSGIVHEAGDRLGVHGKRLVFEGHERADDRDVYTFCRTERHPPLGFRRFDGACVTLVCASSDPHSCM